MFPVFLKVTNYSLCFVIYCDFTKIYKIEINYQTTILPKWLTPKLNYFVRDFLNDYSDYLNEMEAGTDFDTEVEYEGDLEVYFVKFIFRKAGDKFFSRVNNELSLYCNGEFIVDYIDYYNNKRIKAKLKGLSPVQYRTKSFQ